MKLEIPKKKMKIVFNIEYDLGVWLTQQAHKEFTTRTELLVRYIQQEKDRIKNDESKINDQRAFWGENP